MGGNACYLPAARAPHQAPGQPDAEGGGFAEPEDRPGQRAQIRLPDQPAEGSERRAGALRRGRDRVDRAGGEGTSAERDGEPGQPAADGHDEGGVPALPDARRRQPVLAAPGRDGEGQPGGTSDDHALEPAPDREVDADQRGEAPAGQPLDRGADESAAQRARGRQGERAMGGRGRLGEREARADAGAAQRAAAGADHRQDRGDGDRGGAARRGGEAQPADSAGGDPGQGAAHRGPGPPCCGEPCGTAAIAAPAVRRASPAARPLRRSGALRRSARRRRPLPRSPRGGRTGSRGARRCG